MTTENPGAQGGHTPLTPPPSPATSPAPGAPEPGRSSGATGILVLTAVVGGIALVGAGGTAAVAATGTLLSSNRADAVQTLDVDGLTAIDLDADASMVRIEFANIDEAELSVANGRGTGWTFEREGDQMVVRSPQPVFGWWFGNWFGEEGRVVLTLPEELSGTDLGANLTLDAGSLDVSGEFGTLEVQVNAGSLDIAGAAEVFDVQMNAGRADVVLDGVTQADLGIAAGDLTVELTGEGPSATTIDVNAGSLNLTLPDVDYRIRQDVSAGSFDATVDESSGARRTIDVSLAAGRISIQPGR